MDGDHPSTVTLDRARSVTGVPASAPPPGPVQAAQRVPEPARPSALGVRFWGLWTATGVSSIGDGMVTVALPLLAVSITRDGLALGGVLAALTLPWLFFALPLGALADRLDRRRMAVRTELVRMGVLLAFALAVATGVRGLPLLYTAAFLMGALEASFFAATASAIPDLVEGDALARANGHFFAVNTAGENFIGVGLGGLAFAAFAALPFVLDGASFAASAALLLVVLPGPLGTGPRHARAQRRVAETSLAPGRPQSLTVDVVAGLRYLLRSAALRILLVFVAGLAFLQAMVMGVLVAYGRGPLHLSESGYGAFLAVAATGAVTSGLLAGRTVKRLGESLALVLAGAVAALAYVLLASSAVVLLAGLAVFAEGFAVTLGNVAYTTARQERVPSRLLGRTSAAFRMLIYGSVPFGALAGGLLAHVWSVRLAIAVAGALQALLVAAVAGPIHRRLAEPLVDLTRGPEGALIDLRGGVSVPVVADR